MVKQISSQLQIGDRCVVYMKEGNWPRFFDGRTDPPAALSQERIEQARTAKMKNSTLQLGQRLLTRAVCLLTLWSVDRSHKHDTTKCQRCLNELVDALERRDVDQVKWWCVALWPVLKKLSEAEPDAVL